MLSLKRFVKSVVYVLSYFAREVFVSIPYRALLAMAHFLGAGNARIVPIENNERTYRNTSFGTNGNDSESMDSHDSDSDESFTCEYDSTWDEEVDTSVLTRVTDKYNSSKWTTE